MGSVCRKVSECQAYGVKNHQETQEGYFKIIQSVIARDDMFAGWLDSPNFQEDLENLYFLYEPSKDELDKLVDLDEKEAYIKIGKQQRFYYNNMVSITENLLSDRVITE